MRVVRRLAFTVGIVALVAVAAWTLILPRLRPHIFHGVVMQSPTAAPAIDLESTTGEPLGLDSFNGKLVVVYFGYTHCPDVCPTTLNALHKTLEDMGDDAAQVQVVMVTVDPQRDTADMLAEYLAFFDDRFIGLTGNIDDVSRVATTYGVYFQAREGDVESGYIVDHTAHMIVIDRTGHLRLLLPPELEPEDIAADLEYLL